jgi:death-on-curing protein
MRYLTLGEVLDLHRRITEQTGGAVGVRDLGGVESAVAQPQMTFGGEELYATIESKATALCFSLVMNHPFMDGNKRIGHAALETFLVMNGFELAAHVDDVERATDNEGRVALTFWFIRMKRAPNVCAGLSANWR